MFGFGGQGGGGGFWGGQVPGRFDRQYQCFPVSFIGKDDLENSNKIILPPSALDHLVRLHISYPMLFEVSNPNYGRRTHSGVWEFISEEGMCYMPFWMMNNLLLEVGDMLCVKNTSLPKGSFVKLQPVSSDFLAIHNPKAVLENTLRHFATLTVGDCIVLNYNNKKYEIEIIETKPAAAISIIEADVNVDFAPPKDYKEEEHRMPTAPEGAQFNRKENPHDAPPEEPKDEPDVFRRFSGAGHRVDGKAIKAASPAVKPVELKDDDEEEPWKKRIPKGVKWTTAPYMFNVGHNSVQNGKNPKPVEAPEPLELFGGIGRFLQ